MFKLLCQEIFSTYSFRSSLFQYTTPLHSNVRNNHNSFSSLTPIPCSRCAAIKRQAHYTTTTNKELEAAASGLAPPKNNRGALGTFNDYVDTILSFFDHLLTSTWTLLTLGVDKNKHFWTTYPPLPFLVVIERSLIC